MKPIKSIVMVVIILVFASCKNDDDITINPQNQDPDPTAFAQNFGSEITRTFLGTVVDTNNNPIENVSISIGSATAMTDSNGVFIISDATVNKRFGYVKAEKTGYIHASRAVVPSEGTNKVRIMMLPETVAGSTSSGTQETIALGNGASVALEGDYIKPDGTAYSGTVNVIMHHLDPADDNMEDQMPGMLYAANAQNEERMLQTFGMLAVELRGDNGEDLNLAEGSTAEITVPLDASLIADAPATIPLWYFDETHGYWIEDGIATLVDNQYVGTVSHFSFWNCDIPAEAVNLCVMVSFESDNLISNLFVTITSDTYGTRSGYTNESGEVCGLVPSNESLIIEVFSFGICGNNAVYSDTIGPFGTDANISVTIPDSPNITSETVTGIFNDCSGNPITDGYVILVSGNQQFIDHVSDGNFEIDLIRCEEENSFTIQGIDFDGFNTTGEIDYTFASPVTNIGTLITCNSFDEYITYQIDQDEQVTILTDLIAQLFFFPSGSTIPRLIVQSSPAPDQEIFFFRFRLNDNPPYTGAYNTTGGFGDDIGFGVQQPITINGESNSTVVSYITNFGEVNEYIDINFDGTYDDASGTTHTFSGVIHILRDE